MSEWKRGKAKTLCSLNAGWFLCIANDEKFVFFCCRFQFNIFMSPSYSFVRKTSLRLRKPHGTIKSSTRWSQIWFSSLEKTKFLFIVTLFLWVKNPCFTVVFWHTKTFTIHMELRRERGKDSEFPCDYFNDYLVVVQTHQKHKTITTNKQIKTQGNKRKQIIVKQPLILLWNYIYFRIYLNTSWYFVRREKYAVDDDKLA